MANNLYKQGNETKNIHKVCIYEQKKRSLVVLKLLKSSLIPPKQKETFWVTDKNQQFINKKINIQTRSQMGDNQQRGKTQIHRRTTYNIRVRRTFFFW